MENNQTPNGQLLSQFISGDESILYIGYIRAKGAFYLLDFYERICKSVVFGVVRAKGTIIN